MPYMAGLSPDGGDIAFTGYSPAGDQSALRPYDYNLPVASTRVLLDSPRSEVTFVKDGWVWYREEVVCNDCPGGTQASGKVFALNIAAGGAETPVVFAAGESPAELKSGWGPGEFYPNS